MKKMRLAMAQYYTKLQDEARIENFLTGKVQDSSKAKQGDGLITVPEQTLLAPDNPDTSTKGASKPRQPRSKTAAGPSSKVRQ